MAIKLKRTGDGGYTYPSKDGGQWHVGKSHDQWVVFHRRADGRRTSKVNSFSRLFQVRVYIEIAESDIYKVMFL